MQNILQVEKFNNRATINSLQVAEGFGKRHDNILRDIEHHISKFDGSNLSREIFKKNKVKEYFIQDAYTSDRGKTYKIYRLTQKGFNLLAMSYNGKKFIQYKIALLEHFEEMEKEIEHFKIERAIEKPIRKNLTDAIKDYKFYNTHSYKHFTDLCFKKVTGYNAKQLKNNRQKNKNAIDLLNSEELKKYRELEEHVTSLIYLGVDYKNIKNIVQNFDFRR